MLIKGLPLGDYMTNCYILTDEETMKTAIIDPGAESSVVLDYLEMNNLKAECILLTHGHFDHTGAVLPLYEALSVPVYIHRADTDAALRFGFPFLETSQLSFYGEGDVLTLGSLKIDAINTPGHTAGSVCLLCKDAMFSGDTLFRDSCGRTDLQGGNTRQMTQSLKRLHELPGDYDVYPGHELTTTLERERKHNFYMRSALEQR